MADQIVDVFADGAEVLGASAKMLECGHELVEDGRISRPAIGARQVAAFVGDPRRGRVKVRIRLGDGGLTAHCTCGRTGGRPCAHAAALALLLAGAARPGVASDTAADSLEARQIRRRQERGRSGLFAVAAEHDGGSAFGAYRVSSPSEREYQVVLRAVDARHNSCSCADLGTNRVGTCKHIEAVLAWLERGRRRSWLKRAREAGPAHSYLHIDDGGLRVRLRRRSGRGERGAAGRWFDEDGRLRGELAAVWPELAREAGDAGIEVPEEVRAHGERALEAAARQARWRRVEAEVRRAGAEQPGFAGRLYPYQIDGVGFLASRGRALLADDMGLGKTAQAIAAMVRMMRKGEAARALVVCPASLKHQWQQEIARFAPGLQTTVIGGNRGQRSTLYRGAGDVVIINYELARSDRTELAGLGADLLVLDEAQRIKNWRTRTAEAIKAIETRHAFVLTGTPLENRLDDLYSLMQVVDPHVLGPLWQFNRDFTSFDDNGKAVGYRNLTALRARLAPHMLRRRKQDVLTQLPELITTRRSIELGPGQRQVHDDAQQAVSRLLVRLKKRPLTPAEEKRLLQGFQRMRMACDAPELVGEPPVRGGAPKLVELARLLEEICVEGGHKVVVFSEWEKMQALAAGVAESLGLGAVRLHGGVPSGSRGALIRRFSDDPGCQVFLSTDAGGVGLNLQAASHLINLDLPWNPAVLAQRIGRIHRLGQRSAASVILLVGADSIEERMQSTLAGKRALFEAAVGDDTDTDQLDRTTLARRVATLLEESYAAATGPGPAVRATAPERPGASVESLRAVLGEELRGVLRLPGRGTIAVVADGTRVLETALGGAVAMPASAAAALRALGADSPIAGAEVLYQAAEDDSRRQRNQLAAAIRKLEAARTLELAGLGGEALGLLHGALALACRACAGSDPGDAPGAILASVYGELIPAGALRADDAHALTRAGELARAFANAPAPPPAGLCRDLLADTGDLLARLRERLADDPPSARRAA